MPSTRVPLRGSGLYRGVCVQNINWTCGRRRVKVMVDNEMPLDTCAAYELRWGGKVVMMAAQRKG